MNDLEADRADLDRLARGLPAPAMAAMHLADGGVAVGTLAAGLADALDAALGQDALLGHIQHPVLEGSAADIWNQTLHR